MAKYKLAAVDELLVRMGICFIVILCIGVVFGAYCGIASLRDTYIKSEGVQHCLGTDNYEAFRNCVFQFQINGGN